MVLPSRLADVFQNELNVNNKIKPIRTFPNNENSSNNIFSEKYDETPSVKYKPNLRNIKKLVNKIPRKVISFFKTSDDGIVIVKKSKISAVNSKTTVGDITIKLKPIISDIDIIYHPQNKILTHLNILTPQKLNFLNYQEIFQLVT